MQAVLKFIATFIRFLGRAIHSRVEGGIKKVEVEVEVNVEEEDKEEEAEEDNAQLLRKEFVLVNSDELPNRCLSAWVAYNNNLSWIFIYTPSDLNN